MDRPVHMIDSDRSWRLVCGNTEYEVQKTRKWSNVTCERCIRYKPMMAKIKWGGKMKAVLTYVVILIILWFGLDFAAFRMSPQYCSMTKNWSAGMKWVCPGAVLACWEMGQ